MNLKDLDYLCARTKLSLEKAILLSEQESDLDLILDNLPNNKNFNYKEIADLSPEIALKLIIFNLTRDKNDIKLEEKSYVARAISDFLPKMMNCKELQFELPKIPTENTSKYHLILNSVFDIKIKGDVNCIKQGFLISNKKELARNTEKWLEILGDIKSKGWI